MNSRPSTRWTAEQLARLALSPSNVVPNVTLAEQSQTVSGQDIWDPWPIQTISGSPSAIAGGELWIALSAPVLGHPEHRHDRARLRLLQLNGNRWSDLGLLFAANSSPGSREWSGSAVAGRDGVISVYYTAAGERGEPHLTFSQRVMEARLKLVFHDDRVVVEETSAHREIVRSDGTTYLLADEREGAPGQIRAFRDPGWFQDPADGREYLLIATSLPHGDRFTGAVGLAEATTEGWDLLPPLLSANGLNHELERPHLVAWDSLYYLFFSTQRHTFHPADRAPTGLYGFVAPSLHGPYEPLNGSGLVLQNPPDAPDQAYAWLVLKDRRVASFLNFQPTTGPDPRHANANEARAKFGGSIAPFLRLELDGHTARLVSDPTVTEWIELSATAPGGVDDA